METCCCCCYFCVRVKVKVLKKFSLSLSQFFPRYFNRLTKTFKCVLEGVVCRNSKKSTTKNKILVKNLEESNRCTKQPTEPVMLVFTSPDTSAGLVIWVKFVFVLLFFFFLVQCEILPSSIVA